MDYKYPYIPKEYYAATMFACKMIRGNGYFNKAINIAANYYMLDKEELRKHVVARTTAGKKLKSETGYKMKTYEVIIACACDANPEPSYRVEKVKGKSEESVRKRFEENCLRFTRRNDTGSNYSPYEYVHDVREVEE